MAFKSNTTMPLTGYETALGQPNLPCGLHVPHSTAERFSFTLLCCVNLMGSFFGNIFIVIIVYKHRELRKTINYFIGNMAVSDLIFPLMVIPVNVIGLAKKSWHWPVSGIFGSIFCTVVPFLER